MIRQYRCLKNISYHNRIFELVPLRDIDKFAILKMRNEQIYHLRQAKPLTVEMQEVYFSNVIDKLFDEDEPSQVLFSLLENKRFVGYGGLVHINWVDKNAEISFIMETALENNGFSYYWTNYLEIIQQIAFEGLNLHKIYTFAFDIRPHLYTILEASGFSLDARLKEHCLFNGKYLDVVIHSKFR